VDEDVEAVRLEVGGERAHVGGIGVVAANRSGSYRLRGLDQARLVA
jgi:hypothetical protein